MHVFNAQPGQQQLHMPEKLLIDNFAGGGGASLGMEMAFGRPVDAAINHNEKALGMHYVNHPNTDHYIESVWDVDPLEITRGQPVEAAWFSPDCTHHSKARGGKPKKKEIRGLAWVAIRWMLEVRPEIVPIENVEEFRTWGPLDADGHAIKERAGETFDAFCKIITTGIEESHPGYLECLEFLKLEIGSAKAQKLAAGLGYVIDFRELRACDFGAPTTRKRFFMVARCDGYPVVWPEATHGKPDSIGVQSGELHPYKTAADCIDWSVPVNSIFGRKKPLAENTMKRIARGLEKFVLNNPNPFVISQDEVGFISKHKFMSAGTSLSDPLHTITAGGDSKRPAGAAHSMALTKVKLSPLITECANASSQRNMPADEPLRTITAQTKGGTFALVTAHIERQFSTSTGNDIKAPLGTIMTQGAGKSALVTAFLAKHYVGNYSGSGIPMNAPTDTITTTDHHALVNAFLVKYYSEGGQWADVRDPMHTIPTKDRLGLVVVRGDLYRIVDIGMRMLTPEELFKAQGFLPGYIHDHYIDANGEKHPLTKADQVRMVGNSVSPPVAAAILKANIEIRNQVEVAA